MSVWHGPPGGARPYNPDLPGNLKIIEGDGIVGFIGIVAPKPKPLYCEAKCSARYWPRGLYVGAQHSRGRQCSRLAVAVAWPRPPDIVLGESFRFDEVLPRPVCRQHLVALHVPVPAFWRPPKEYLEALSALARCCLEHDECLLLVDDRGVRAGELCWKTGRGRQIEIGGAA